MTPPTAQAIAVVPVAQATPALVQTAPAGGLQTGLKVQEGCGPFRCIHITVMIFGIINVILGILSLFSENVVGLVMFLVMGSLGIAAGAMANPCGCCSDPVPGTCHCCNPAGTKCIAAVSITNSVFHVVIMIFIIVSMVVIGEGCDVTGNNRCLGIGGAIVAILGAFLAWFVVSLIICVVAAVYAFKATGSAAP